MENNASVVSPNRFSPKSSHSGDTASLPLSQFHDVNSLTNSLASQAIGEEFRNGNLPPSQIPPPLQNSQPFTPFTSPHPAPIDPSILPQFPGLLSPFNCCPMNMPSLDSRRENGVPRSSPPTSDMKTWFSQLAGQTPPDFLNLGFLNKKPELLNSKPNLNEMEQLLKSIPRPQDNGVRGGALRPPPPPPPPPAPSLLQGFIPPGLLNPPPDLISPLVNIIQSNPMMMQFLLSKLQQQQSPFGTELPKWLPDIGTVRDATTPRPPFKEKSGVDSSGTAKRKRGRPIYISPETDLVSISFTYNHMQCLNEHMLLATACLSRPA